MAADDDHLPQLSDEERTRYAWQISGEGFGELGQRRLRAATVLVSRVGGVGGIVAYQLAAAGVGRLILAHAGNLRSDDLNRQLLMTHDWIGRPRAESAARRLRELNPHVEIEIVAENVSPANADRLIERCDAVVDAAPLFEERFAMNRAAVKHRVPLIDSGMYEFDAQLTTIIPGQTACLACIYPELPPAWNRRFPVFGAVAGTIGSLAAVETIKILAGLHDPLAGKMLYCDLRTMAFRTLALKRNPNCTVCGDVRSRYIKRFEE